MRRSIAVFFFAGVPLGACGSGGAQEEGDPQGAFFASLQAMCGQAYAGTVVESVPPDTSFVDQLLIMHVRECDDDVVRIPFHVGEDRSRTWVITRTAEGLRLKHDHRHVDGSEDAVTQYGGDTSETGTARRQDFPADAHTAALVPVAAANVWRLEIHPGEMFAYALRREGAERRFRVEFDLAAPVSPPPPPWGS